MRTIGGRSGPIFTDRDDNCEFTTPDFEVYDEDDAHCNIIVKVYISLRFRPKLARPWYCT